MARKKDKTRKPPTNPFAGLDEPGNDGPVVLPKVPDKLSSPFANVLKGMKAPAQRTGPRPAAATGKPGAGVAGKSGKEPAAPKPAVQATPEQQAATMRDAMNQLDRAYRGVTKLGEKAVLRRAAPNIPVRPPEQRRSSDDGARAELASLVAGGVQFEVERDEDGRVTAYRKDHGPALVKELKGGRASPAASIDLHGLRADDAETRVVKFLRDARMRGVRVALIIHGKGMHSETAEPVLRERVVEVLSHGAGAPLCVAFRSAEEEMGGTGAMLVLLSRVK